MTSFWYSFPAGKLSKSEVDENLCKKVVVGPAYIDFTPRTVKGLHKNDIEEPVLNQLAKKIFECIINRGLQDQGKFDEWHKDICRWFQEEFTKVTHKKINSGKAQKIINMISNICIVAKGLRIIVYSNTVICL